LEARRSRMRCGKKRPHGQLHKVAKAASLRAAFPEEGDTTAEEMEGQTIEPPPPAPVPADNWKPPQPPQNEGPPADQELDHDPETGEVGPRAVERGDNESWRDWCARLLVHIRKEEKFEPTDECVKANQAAITAPLKDAPKIQCIACGGDRQAPRGNPRAARGNRGRRADAQAM